MSSLDDAFPLSSLGSRIGLPSEAGIESAHGSDRIILARDLRVTTPRARQSAPSLHDCVRLCIFNVGSTTVQEAWHILSGILTPSEYSQIAKLQRVSNASSHPRIDMWVRKDLGASLVRTIREATKRRTPSFVKSITESADGDNYRKEACSGWRLAIWQSWHDRNAQSTPQLPLQKQTVIPPGGLRFATLNVNGFNSKREQVVDFLQKQRITVCALQETLVSRSQFPVKAPGYKSYVRDWQEGFRGQAVLVSSLLPSYQVPHDKETLDGYQYLIHVRLPDLPGFNPPRSMHFVGVYLPSGGNMRSLRTKGFQAVCDLYGKIYRKDNDALVVCMGDWNVSEELLIRRIKTSNLHYLRPVGSSVSRFPTKGRSSSLDHVVASPIGGALLRRPRVYRSICLSDHRPVVVTMGATSPEKDCATTCAPRMRLNKRELAKNSFDFVNDNRWLAIADININGTEALSSAASRITSTLLDIGSSTGVYKEVQSAPRKAFMPKRLKLLLSKYRQLSDQVAFELHTHMGGPLVDSKLRVAYETAKTRFRKAFAGWKRGEQSKHYARIAEDFLVHDHANVWSRLRSQVNTENRGEKPSPVRNKAGTLSVDDDSHIAAVKEHYEALAHDDANRRSRDVAYWDTVEFSYPRQEPIADLNASLGWHEVIKAIRGMNRDTAPGLDKMHVNLLKTLVREECMLAAFGTDKADHPDNTIRSLPLDKFPEDPLSPMGKALWKVLSKTWALERVPEGWNTVAICNLFKKGDPELLVNYRGLSLISVSLKIILVVMVHRLEKKIDDNTISISRCQSGFRKREEAISQFLVMAESARRRHLNKLPTYATFIDLIKAYDKVPHRGLYRVLARRGITGKFLNFIISMYQTSKMAIRACGKLSEPFDMWRGLRQGCPLSPLLFIIYIDMFLRETDPGPPLNPYIRLDEQKKGLAIPVKLRRNVDGPLPPTKIFIGGGMYADDIVCFDDSVQACQTRCINIDAWGDKWGMYVNYAKSGVMLWSSLASEKSAFDKAEFKTPRGIYPKVGSYKYLGIEVTAHLPCFMGPDDVNLWRSGDGTDNDAMRFAKSQAAKGMEALSVLKPILTDRACPIPLKSELIKAFVMSVMAYGAEFIGFNKQLAQPIQRVLDLAVRWSFGLKKSNTQTCSLNLSMEMGLPLAYEFFAGQRARLFHKLRLSDKGEEMQTNLPILQADHKFAPQRTWCSETEMWLKRFHAPKTKRDVWLENVASGIDKYAPVEFQGNDEVQKLFWSDLDSGDRAFDAEGYGRHCAEVRDWLMDTYTSGRSRGSDPPCPEGFDIFRDYTVAPVPPDTLYPVRGWYVFARMCELHRRSNSYRSSHLQFYRRLLLGVDDKGRILAPGTVLEVNEIQLLLEYVTKENLVQRNTTIKETFGAMPAYIQADQEFERSAQEQATSGGMSAGPRRSFMREVRECALERQFVVDGGRAASFTGWYDKFQFGATRDYLRTTLSRPDLTRGVKWLALVRVGGFPRVFNTAKKLGQADLKHTCPLCGGRVELGADYIHLAMNCDFKDVSDARSLFLSKAIDTLRQDKVTQAFFDYSPDMPDSVRDYSLSSFRTDLHSGLVNFGCAIRLAGGCLRDPRESAFLLSFGQCDTLFTDLDTFGYVSLASFLQAVAPLYCGAIGVDYRRGIDLRSPVSSCLGQGGSASLERSNLNGLSNSGLPDGDAAMSSPTNLVGRETGHDVNAGFPVGRARYSPISG